MIFQSFGIHLSILICQATHQLVVKIAFTNYFFLSSLMAHFDPKYHYLLKKNSPPKKFKKKKFKNTSKLCNVENCHGNYSILRSIFNYNYFLGALNWLYTLSVIHGWKAMGVRIYRIFFLNFGWLVWLQNCVNTLYQTCVI